MGFSPSLKGRAWIGVLHIQNFKNLGIEEEEYMQPEKLAEILKTIWNDSGNGRTCGIAVCNSAENTYHVHMALYGNTTTLKNVSNILGNAHIEPQLGGKKELTSYLKKEGKYAEKNETVLYTLDLEVIQDKQGTRNDLTTIEQLLRQGLTPQEIFFINFEYRKYEKMISSAYVDMKLLEMPILKEMHNEYHFGESGTGKTFLYTELCRIHGNDKVYLMSDIQNGGLDFYIKQGLPPILFIDDLKIEYGLQYSTLLHILDRYSRKQIHSRYQNVYTTWTSVFITSIFPIEKLYEFLVLEQNRKNDTLMQLIRRFNLIVYHYKKDGEYKIFTLPAEEYINAEDMIQKALGDKDGFISIKEIESEQIKLPFKN